jgi:hypothetical protein
MIRCDYCGRFISYDDLSNGKAETYTRDVWNYDIDNHDQIHGAFHHLCDVGDNIKDELEIMMVDDCLEKNPFGSGVPVCAWYVDAAKAQGELVGTCGPYDWNEDTWLTEKVNKENGCNPSAGGHYD